VSSHGADLQRHAPEKSGLRLLGQHFQSPFLGSSHRRTQTPQFYA
jgi:hypothetical protein